MDLFCDGNAIRGLQDVLVYRGVHRDQFEGLGFGGLAATKKCQELDHMVSFAEINSGVGLQLWLHLGCHENPKLP